MIVQKRNELMFITLCLLKLSAFNNKLVHQISGGQKRTTHDGLSKNGTYEAVAESPFPPTISACPTDGVLIPLGQAI